MGKKVFNGKCYFEPEVETQAALASVGIYTFRYYPQDKIIMSSDYAVVYFGGEKFITDLKNNVYVNMALEEGKIQSLFEKIEKTYSDNEFGALSYDNLLGLFVDKYIK